MAEILENCSNSCNSSYGATKEDVLACQKGCQFMQPTITLRRQEVNIILLQIVLYNNNVVLNFS